MTNTLVSEWDPIMTPALTPYAWVRVNDGVLELRLERNGMTVKLDAKAIPQLIKILTRLDTTI